MTLKYESEILFDLMKRDGDDAPSDVLPYESELKEKYLEQVEGAYPKLQDYRSEWLNYNLNAHLPADFPMETLSNVTEATVDNVVPYAYGSAILKGNTKYRDIDAGEFLETFEEGRNLELVSVKMPVLTTSNEDGTKSNILTTNEDVELRGVGDVQDTLNLMTGELAERIGEVVLDGSEVWGLAKTKEKTQVFELGLSVNQKLNNAKLNSSIVCDKIKVDSGVDDEIIVLTTSLYLALLKSKASTVEELKVYLSQNPITIQYQLETLTIKTVDLTVTDQDGNTKSIIRPIEGTMHVSTSSQTLPPLLDMSVPVEATSQNLMSFANIVEVE